MPSWVVSCSYFRITKDCFWKYAYQIWLPQCLLISLYISMHLIECSIRSFLIPSHWNVFGWSETIFVPCFSFTENHFWWNSSMLILGSSHILWSVCFITSINVAVQMHINNTLLLSLKTVYTSVNFPLVHTVINRAELQLFHRFHVFWHPLK
jgi:hypothetical protein